MTLQACLILGAIVFGAGVFGLVTRRNPIALFLSIELMLTGALINLVAFGRFMPAEGDAQAGTILPLFIIAITACEMAVGLALVVALHRQRGQIDLSELRDLHG
ncbi:MAG: NADH-quinone oxidoreductase subunit NuoK [Planctomycetota bacterium]|jgi:NADH:ubiquinone oxidoreductase subunit K|nr:NADH-quinone oxidoreductase subunit NuoK [Planctomycetota bacterium]